MPGIYTSTGPVRKRAVSSRSSHLRLPSGYYRQAPSDPITLSAIKKKKQLIFRTQLRQLNGGKDGTSRWIFNKRGHLFITHVCSHAVNEAIGVRDKTRARKITTAVCLLLLLYMHLTVSTLRTRHHNVYTKKTPGKEGAERDP